MTTDEFVAGSEGAKEVAFLEPSFENLNMAERGMVLKCRGIDAILKVKDIWTGKFSNQKAIAA
jgi:hypothetical protein